MTNFESLSPVTRTPRLFGITNTPRDYAWGVLGGISALFNQPETTTPQAELWLGAHPLAPSQFVSAAPWADLHQWQIDTGIQLPVLLKVLAAASPLSIQAHPTRAQAEAGFAAEEGAGVPLEAAQRNYKDPHPKPEILVALTDGFEALGGFRPLPELLGTLAALATSQTSTAWQHWLELLSATPDGLAKATAWVLSGEAAVNDLVAEFSALLPQAGPDFAHLARIAETYPGDPGVLVAAMMNHFVLGRGDAIWLPAGVIHAYLRGIGVELMGPSDNVLRGGLTSKHIDVPELLKVVDFRPGHSPILEPGPITATLRSYRPSQVDLSDGLELFEITGDAALSSATPSVGIVIEGGFRIQAEVECVDLQVGQAFFVDSAANLEIQGSGLLYLAHTRIATS